MPVHAWHRLCESVSSRSAICPRPGSLIREESCGKVCVSLLGAPCSHYSCLLARGAFGNNTGGGAWWALSHIGPGCVPSHSDIVKTGKGEELKLKKRNKRSDRLLWRGGRAFISGSDRSHGRNNALNLCAFCLMSRLWILRFYASI